MNCRHPATAEAIDALAAKDRIKQQNP